MASLHTSYGYFIASGSQVTSSVFGALERMRNQDVTATLPINPLGFIHTSLDSHNPNRTMDREVEFLNPCCTISLLTGEQRKRKILARKTALLDIPGVTDRWVQSVDVNESSLVILANKIDQRVLREFHELLDEIATGNLSSDQESIYSLTSRLKEFHQVIEENESVGPSIRTLPERIQRVISRFLCHIEMSTDANNPRPFYVKKRTCDFLRKMLQGGVLQDSGIELYNGKYGRVEQRKMVQTDGSLSCYAVKSATRRKSSNESILKEVKVSAVMPTHPSVMDIIFFRHNKRLNVNEIVMELAEQDVTSYILRDNYSISVIDTMRGLYALTDGLAHFEKYGVRHRDIKPENTLLIDGKYVICDFGMSEFSDEKGFMHGTYEFLPIELISEGGPSNVSNKSDVWSLGMTILTILSWDFASSRLFEYMYKKKFPEMHGSDSNYLLLQLYQDLIRDPQGQAKIHKWIDCLGRRAIPIGGVDKHWFTHNKLESLKKMLKGMLMIDPSKRISAEDALGFDIFEEFRNESTAGSHKHK